MALSVVSVSINTASPCALNLQKLRRETTLPSWLNRSISSEHNKQGLNVVRVVRASCLFNPTNEPILKDALKRTCPGFDLLNWSMEIGLTIVLGNDWEIEGLVHGVFAIVEPVAFMGGMFAGLLRLDLKEDPLKEWVTRTVEASGITEEDIDAEGSQQEEQVPLEIEIE
ncbi:hypothetical protein DKX38_005720 [Salix brachista]|uniref:Uncharacterized protein n=2 Tax=Salix TaxID=40685 RepID=A0A5N5N2C0_9ROSI|nr:hypothetical protein DKX38_005720 [Salix brachista]